ncbi:S8 family serine peptidase [uncultured Gimesia sp.]|uniref:S8 family serine peptidase n=1 Tax=uncultured Gimesia sp. TaxID=1678688 RepID=UPI00260A3869|nr:S8 family serine peptidase [uncultured Gimesia sp.]
MAKKKAKSTGKKRRTTKSTKATRPARKKASKPAKKSAYSSTDNKLSVEITLAPPAGSNILTPFSSIVRPTARNASQFHADSSQIDRALGALTKLGFDVLAVSSTSISVECTSQQFTEVFGTQLESSKMDTSTQATASAETFLAPAKDAVWAPPIVLEGLVERAYIQPPFLYFENPFPPSVDYHHIRVPGDLAFLTNAARVHREGITGKGVRVAMIDSGFYIQHPYYEGMGYNMSRMLGPGASNVEHDENGHGTAEAANILAIAPDITFIGVKTGNSLAASFKKTVELNPDIISISLGWDLRGADGLPLPSLPGFLSSLETEIADAVASGITVCISSGNGHIGFPGMHPDIVSAGGAYLDENMAVQASDYSSAFKSAIYPGRNVPDLSGLVGLKPHADYIMLPLEPGCSIDSDGSAHDGTNNNDGWAVISGTSAAAPQLAGVCALLKQQNPGLTPSDIRGVLKLTARDVQAGHANEVSNPVKIGGVLQHKEIFASSGPDGATGHGLVDAFAAWKQV